ncbi:MAG: HPr family phosphocarrier protein [Alphaproteobacteria bacterium]|jgi:phosphocarrier protein HPr|nr:HPr family phosphocarrier protein [Alphaproteobacteria bacterium]
MSDPISRTVTIVNQRGLHARAASKFATASGQFKSEVTVEKDGQTVTGLSIMGLMMLAAGIGSEITIHVRGEDAREAIESLTALVESRFGENE